MPTKTKTAGSAHSTPERSLETKFSEALDLVGQKHYDKAIAALEALAAEAGAAGHVALTRSARSHLSALLSRGRNVGEIAANPVLDAHLAINQGKADEALDLLAAALKSGHQDARLFYLKAIAHGQKEETEACAEAMKKALALNPDLVHQFRLEKDFDKVRSSAACASLGLD